MKAKTKKIIILCAAVAAVVAYVLWRKGVFGKKSETGDETAKPDTSTVAAICAAAGLTAAETKQALQVEKSVNASSEWYAKEIAKVGKYPTLEAVIVIDALWLLYRDGGQWKTGGEAAFNAAQEKVLALF